MPRKKPKNTVIVEELEPRILFSAGGLDDAGHVGLADQTLERVLRIAELPAGEHQPFIQEFNSTLAFASANSSVLNDTYYLDDIDGLADKPVGYLKATVPTDSALIDYNESGGDDGLEIEKGGSGHNEADSAKYQTWLVDANNETLSGAVELDIWSALKGFLTDKGARIDAYLIDSDFTGTNITVIASDSIQRSDWDVTDSATWVQDTFDFGNVDHTFGAGRHLGIKLIVHSSSEDDMMFAYDTTAFDARLTVAAAINTVVVDTAVDEDNGDVSSISALIASPGGAGISFREAIQAANNTANGASPDRIHFDIVGTPAIMMTGVLPAISEAVVIDGTTDSDYATNSTPVIELNGQGIINPGLRITGDNVIIRGLAVNNFVSNGIEILGDNNRIESSYIGISRDGTSASGNTGLGIRINNGANNQIGAPGVGNVVSGNSLSGIAVVGSGSNNNIIESNRIGTNANGTAPVANGDYGIDLWGGGANNNRVGGDSLAQRNVISGNDWAGVHISGGGGNIVSGNYIGGNGGGAGASNNGGIDIDDSSNNQIGGTAADSENIIAFNTGAGVKVSGVSSDNNSIQRNEIYDNSGIGISHLSGGNDNRVAAQLDNAEHDGAGRLRIQGSYSELSIANQTVSIDYFSNPASELEGRNYLGTEENVLLDNNGYADIEHVFSASISTGEFVSATVTDAAGNTSEFSVSGAVTLNLAPVFENTGPYDVDEGAVVNTVVGDVGANDGDGGATDADVSYSIIANVDPDADTSLAFGIDSDSGEIVVNDPGDLDFEGASSLTITVQVDDGFSTAVTDVTININDIKPTLTATGLGATVAGQPYRLDLIATEPGSNSIGSYTVNWGDGTVTTELYTGSTTTVSHVYNNHGFTNNVTFTAHEASGSITSSDLIASNYIAGTEELFIFDGVTGDSVGTFESTAVGANPPDLAQPSGVAIGPDGNFYISGYESENIVRFAPDGSYLGVFAADAKLKNPSGLTWGGDGNLYVANYSDNKILRFQANGDYLDTWSSGGNLSGPWDLAFAPDGDLYVSSWNNNRIVKIDGASGGTSTVVIGSGAGLNEPEQIVFGENGDLFIANGVNNEVARWDGSTLSTYFTDAELAFASGIVFGPDGQLYVSSYDNDKLLRFDGTSGEVFSDDGPGGLDQPTFLAFTPAHLVTVGPNDPPAATKLNASESYIEDTTLNLIDIVVSDSDHTTTAVTLTLSDLAAGELSTTTSGSVTSTFDSGTGLWSAAGTIADVNAVLADVSYIPALNYDSNFSIASRVSDGIAEITGNKAFSATAINDPPQLTNNNLGISEGAVATFDSSNLSATDVDNINGDLIFNFSSISGGFFELVSAPGVAVSSATQLQVATSQLRFVHDGGESAPTYQVSVSDGVISTPPSAASITFTNVNDTPELTANMLTISEGQTVVLTPTDLAANDPDNINSDLLLTFTNVSGGHFARASVPGVAITSALQSQIALSELVFVHDAGEAAPGYEVTASDPAASSSLAAAASVNFTNVNDAPRIDNLNGNSTVALNDGVALLIDTDVPATVFDADLPTDISGAMLSVQGIGFESLDTLLISPDSNITLSAGMSNGSQLAVAGSVVANLSSVSASGFLINFVSAATTADADAIMARLAFSSTASLLGNRDIEVQYSDGIDSSDIASVSVLVASSSGGVVFGTEDQSYMLTQADFDFTGVTGTNLESIEILGLPADGELSLNDIAVSVGQAITPADIISGYLVFTPAPNANGNNYADFSFQVNNGIVSTNVLAGPTGSSETLEILQESSNFGLGGVYPTGINIVAPNGAIDSDYLALGSILFDSSFNNIGWSNAQLNELDTWVKDGGVLIASSDHTGLDDIATFYGLTIGGDSASTWIVADADHSIFNGRFGPVGPNGTSLATGGANASYFLSSSLGPDDIVLARDSAPGNEPTVVLRPLEKGWILFTGDENVFDSAMAGGGTISTVNDRFAANVFDWAIDQLPAAQIHSLNFSVAAVNDASTAINTNAAESYTEDTPLDLIDIVVSDIDSSTVNAKLSLSTPSAGILSTGSTGTASSTYDPVTGVWLASGSPADLNSLLANLTFTPTDNFEQDFTLDVDINDGAGPQISDSKTFTAIAVNDAPVANAGGPYSITEGDGINFDGSSSFDGDAGDTLKSFQWDLLKGGDLLASDVGSVLSWNQLASFGVGDDGSYQVRLTVSDQAGAQNSDVSSLDVANLDPVFDIVGSGTAYQDYEYSLSLEAIDPGDDPINQWVIDWGDGTVQNVAGTEATASHVYSTGGISPTISVIADTDEGQFAAATLAVSVVPNAAPVGEVLIDNTSPIEEDVLTVTNTLLDDDGISGLISYQWLRDGTAISGANNSSYVVTAEDIGSQLSVQASYIDDRNTPEIVNSAATQIVLQKNRAASLDLEVNSIEVEENNDPSQSIRLTAISVQDDGLGENTVSLSGKDADKFEIVDGILYLKAGVELDYELATRLEVQVNVDDPEVDGTPDDSEVFIVSVGDVAQEFFVPKEKIEPLADAASNEEEVDLETSSAEQVTTLDFAEDAEIEQERGNLPGGTSSAFHEQPVDVDGLLTAVSADQIAKSLFPEQSDFDATTTIVNLANVIDLDSVEVRLAAITLLGELPGIDPMEDFSMLDNSSFTSGLDELRRSVENIDLSDKIVVGSSATVTTGISIGYVVWLIRGSVLLSTILSSLPAWRLIDPLPVISGALSEEDEDEESLESIIEDSSNSESEPVDDDTDMPPPEK